MNTLMNSKYFQKACAKTNFHKNLTKINLSEYYVPKELYEDRLGSFKGFKSPFVNDVVKCMEEGRLIPAVLSEAVIPNKTGDLHTSIMMPHSLFQLQTMDSKGNRVVIVDLSYKAKYNRNNVTGDPIFLDIPDITMYYMMLAGYIQLKISENPKVAENPAFYTKVAEAYSLILSKVIDNNFPVSAGKDTDYDKLYFLCYTFCLQNFFELDKEKAMNYAIKMRMIGSKVNVTNDCLYYNTDFDFMRNVDYKNTFPIDNFINYLPKEYTYIESSKISADLILQRWSTRLTRNAIFTLDCLGSFITMLIFAKGSLGIYNDFMIKQYLDLQSEDILKTLNNVIK